MGIVFKEKATRRHPQLYHLFYHLPWKRTILLPSIKCTTMSMLVERPDDGHHDLGHLSKSVGDKSDGTTISNNDEELGLETGTPSKSHVKANPVLKLLLKLRKKEEMEKKKELTLDMLQPSRYKPNDLEQMAEETKFSKREVRALYRAFKQECPTGIVDEETFKEVYEKIFPLGDASRYAHLVFCAIDREKTGGITSGDFMEFLSVISKGSNQDKLLWAFTFYDQDKDGVICKEEMCKVTEAIHELMGSESSHQSNVAHVNKIFDRMDTNADEKVTLEEFIHYCNTHQNVRESMSYLP